MTDNNTTAKVTPLAYTANSVEAALAPLSGSENGPLTFEAAAPVFSAYIASHGTKAELSALTAQTRIFQRLLAFTVSTTKTGKSTLKFTLNSAVARAFRKCADKTLADGKVRAASQDEHDARLLELAAIWCAFFKDVVPKVKDASKETRSEDTRLNSSHRIASRMPSSA